MLNPDFSIFNDNMFIQVRKILDPLKIETNLSPLDLTIGEPQLCPPDWLNDVLLKEAKNWQAYPKAFADQQFVEDLSVYFDTRFRLCFRPVSAGRTYCASASDQRAAAFSGLLCKRGKRKQHRSGQQSFLSRLANRCAGGRRRDRLYQRHRRKRLSGRYR